MENNEILLYFEQIMKDDLNTSAAVAAIQTLIQFIKVDPAETLAGLRANLKDAINTLNNFTDSSVTSITSGCELFLRFITLASLDHSDFNDCKRVLVERGQLFLQTVGTSRKKISKSALPFITDGKTILTHSRSRVVLQIFKDAVAENRRFRVFVTESLPDRTGQSMYDELTALGIPTTLILDASIGYVMEKVDFVLMGAEGVAESGGIINKIGTYSVAMCAKELNKPFYVLAESFKFTRLYPLNQKDLPNQFKYHASTMRSKNDLSQEHPWVDYTPPAYITLLFTDLGILMPSAVSDELIKLYM
ncbi:translation initiation factor eIF2B subunit alpha-like [Tubulanus polymorphus]|uniref:translation initiation factor eIF2B subunit alpha-like n=1 Tax=Tubulanus polymorphus TaxID=672921 RepID=UPI003DA5ADDE